MKNLLERLEKIHRGSETIGREFAMLEKALQRKFLRRATRAGTVDSLHMAAHAESGKYKIKAQHHDSPLGAAFVLWFNEASGDTISGHLSLQRKPADVPAGPYKAEFEGPSGEKIKGKVRYDNVEGDTVGFLKGALGKLKEI